MNCCEHEQHNDTPGVETLAGGNANNTIVGEAVQ